MASLVIALSAVSCGGANHFQDGVGYWKAEKYGKAIQEFNKAIQLNPDYFEPYIYRGWSYDEIGQYQNAIADYNKVIQLNPDYVAFGYANRGISYRNLGNITQADADKSKACSFDSKYC